MAQYHPQWLANQDPILRRRPRPEEIEDPPQSARAAGLWRIEPAF